MRLLNTETFELDSFPAAEDAPPYAILSHTWGHEEVLFEDARHGKEHLHNCGKEGLDKVLRSTSKANHDGYGYIWIDTCCIDKSSSAELSEAINSMFAWYQHSAVCYAYLVDYEHGTGDQLSASRWFTRGWTLQELIAPSDVQFFDSYWRGFGDRTQLCPEIVSITGIDERALRRQHIKTCQGPHPNEANETKACSLCQENADLDKVLDLFSISSRMSWASNRRTTRVEDIAYSLLGIFKVTMPLLYGEGARAFQRLQHEIARSSHDQTLLVWSDESGEVGHDELFAPHPSMFRMGGEFRPVPGLLDDHSMAITDKGLEIDAYLLQCTVSYPELANVKHKKWWLAVLSCSRVDDDFACAAVLLERTKRASMSFTRSRAEFKTIHGPLLVRYGASTADAPKWPLGIALLGSLKLPPLTVHFDPQAMEKQRIVLHKEIGRKEGFAIPHVRYSFPRGYSGYAPERTAPSPGESIPASKLTLPSTANALFNSDNRGYIYGAISFLDECSDGFFILWGLFYLTDVSNAFALAYLDPEGCFSPNAAPFCRVYRNPARLPLDDAGLDSHDWIKMLIRTAQLEEQTWAVPRSQQLASGSAGCSRTWRNEAKELVHVECRIQLLQFAGRKMYGITVNIDRKRRPTRDLDAMEE